MYGYWQKRAFDFLLCTSRVHVIDKEGLSTLRFSKLDRGISFPFTLSV